VNYLTVGFLWGRKWLVCSRRWLFGAVETRWTPQTICTTSEEIVQHLKVKTDKYMDILKDRNYTWKQKWLNIRQMVGFELDVETEVVWAFGCTYSLCVKHLFTIALVTTSINESFSFQSILWQLSLYIYHKCSLFLPIIPLLLQRFFIFF